MEYVYGYGRDRVSGDYDRDRVNGDYGRDHDDVRVDRSMIFSYRLSLIHI